MPVTKEDSNPNFLIFSTLSISFNCSLYDYFRNHFKRTTVSLGDHNVKIYSETTNVFRKISRILRFPTYDNNLIDGDLALLHLSDPVPLSSKLFVMNINAVIYKKNIRSIFKLWEWGRGPNNFWWKFK